MYEMSQRHPVWVAENHVNPCNSAKNRHHSNHAWRTGSEIFITHAIPLVLAAPVGHQLIINSVHNQFCNDASIFQQLYSVLLNVTQELRLCFDPNTIFWHPCWTFNSLIKPLGTDMT
jgi:hypothetical protein